MTTWIPLVVVGISAFCLVVAAIFAKLVLDAPPRQRAYAGDIEVDTGRRARLHPPRVRIRGYLHADNGRADLGRASQPERMADSAMLRLRRAVFARCWLRGPVDRYQGQLQDHGGGPWRSIRSAHSGLPQRGGHGPHRGGPGTSRPDRLLH